MRRLAMYIGIIGVLGLIGVGAASAALRDAHIAGKVLVCNGPGRCFTRQFVVAAISSAGRTIARTTTTGPDNAYRLRVAPGRYRLVANSSGLVCQGSAVAIAHKTTRRDITCLVP